MAAIGKHSLNLKDFVFNMSGAKAFCLNKAGKEYDMTMMAIEREDDYLDEFKGCVKETMTDFLIKRNEEIDALPSGQGHKFPRYVIDEEHGDKMIDTGLDLIKLAELKEHDHRLYKKYELECKEKWGRPEGTEPDFEERSRLC